MENVSDFTKLILIKNEDGSFTLTKEFEPYEDEDTGQMVSSLEYRCNDLAEIISSIIDNPFTLNWEKLKKEVLLMHAHWLGDNWYSIEEYANINNISRQGVYDRIRRKKLKTFKIGKYTFVSEI